MTDTGSKRAMSEKQMALCLTAQQKKVLDYYKAFYKENGVFPNTIDAARHFNKASPAILNVVGALFLKGAFTDGKPLTNNLKGIHNSGKAAGLKTNVGKSQPKRDNIDTQIRKAILDAFRSMGAGGATLNE